MSESKLSARASEALEAGHAIGEAEISNEGDVASPEADTQTAVAPAVSVGEEEIEEAQYENHPAECPKCHGEELTILGTQGVASRYRCRACGWTLGGRPGA